MAYSIKCNTCGKETFASEIVDLITNHTSKDGRLKCTSCKGNDASIYQENKLQEEGEIWKRYIRGIITIKTDSETYTPYIILVADTERGDITGMHFCYYKDTRRQGGRLKHGHGPGGPPVLCKSELFQLLEKLMIFGCISKNEILDFINKC